ncbi:unnamed protein product [Discosporangium mesarthrocarpum]
MSRQVLFAAASAVTGLPGTSLLLREGLHRFGALSLPLSRKIYRDLSSANKQARPTVYTSEAAKVEAARINKQRPGTTVPPQASTPPGARWALDILSQEKMMLERVTPTDYIKVDPRMQGSIGEHVRHNLDHFAKCLEAIHGKPSTTPAPEENTQASPPPPPPSSSSSSSEEIPRKRLHRGGGSEGSCGDLGRAQRRGRECRDGGSEDKERERARVRERGSKDKEGFKVEDDGSSESMEQDKLEGAGTANYDQRVRNTEVERSPHAAVQEVVRIRAQLKSLTSEDMRKPMLASFLVSDDGGSFHSFSSTVERELGFCAHHAVHHQAMIRSIAAGMNYALPEDFGMNLATREYRRAVGDI